MLDLPDDRRKIRIGSRLVQRVDDVYVRSASGVRDLLCDDLDALRGPTGKENLRALPHELPPDSHAGRAVGAEHDSDLVFQ